MDLIATGAYFLLDIFTLGFWVRQRKNAQGRVGWLWGVMSPTLALYFSVVFILGLIIGVAFINDLFVLIGKRTLIEMEDIRRSAMNYRELTGELPSIIDVITGSNPLRAEQKNNHWGSDYVYERKMTYQIIAPGKDKIIGTEAI